MLNLSFWKKNFCITGVYFEHRTEDVFVLVVNLSETSNLAKAREHIRHNFRHFSTISRMYKYWNDTPITKLPPPPPPPSLHVFRTQFIILPHG